MTTTITQHIQRELDQLQAVRSLLPAPLLQIIEQRAAALQQKEKIQTPAPVVVTPTKAPAYLVKRAGTTPLPLNAELFELHQAS